MMKKTLVPLAAATAFISVAACNKPVAQNEPPSQPEATPSAAAPAIAIAPPAAVAAPTEQPPQRTAPAPETSKPAAPASELAPPGVFYLVEAIRIETDSGVTGLPPGTGVKLLHDDVYLTPAGEAHLRPEQMTNDMALARQILASDRKGEAALKSTMLEQAKAVESLDAANKAQATATQQALMAEQNSTAIQDRIAVLTAEKSALNDKINLLYVKKGNEEGRKVIGRIVSSNTDREINALIDRRAAVEAELGQLRHRR